MGLNTTIERWKKIKRGIVADKVYTTGDFDYHKYALTKKRVSDVQIEVLIQTDDLDADKFKAKYHQDEIRLVSINSFKNESYVCFMKDGKGYKRELPFRDEEKESFTDYIKDPVIMYVCRKTELKEWHKWYQIDSWLRDLAEMELRDDTKAFTKENLKEYIDDMFFDSKKKYANLEYSLREDIFDSCGYDYDKAEAKAEKIAEQIYNILQKAMEYDEDTSLVCVSA